MDIKDVVWRVPVFDFGIWFMLLNVVLLPAMIITMSEATVEPRIRPTSARIAMLVLGFTVLLFYGFFHFKVLPQDKLNWYTNTVTPYLKQLPQQRMSGIKIKPLAHYKNDVFRVKVGVPDAYGFLSETEYYGTIHRNTEITDVYLTFKTLEQDLGVGIKEGDYDVQFYVPDALYNEIMSDKEIYVTEQTYSVFPKTSNGSVVLFWVSVSVLLALLIRIIIVSRFRSFPVTADQDEYSESSQPLAENQVLPDPFFEQTKNKRKIR